MTPDLTRQRFETYQAERQPEAFAAARAFADDPDRANLVLVGPPGTGKTHLLAAIVRHLLPTPWHPVYWIVPDLLAHLREGVEDAGHELERRLALAIDAELLVLDDLGAEKATDWSREILFRLLNARLNRGAPFALSSNLPPSQLEDERLGSRLADRARCRVVKLRQADYRVSDARAAERLVERQEDDDDLPF